MPEGDTIHRTAATLRRALRGREVRAATSSVAQIRRYGTHRLVGQTVADVEARGKHLLCWFEPSGVALHTHMRMSGSWHLYQFGERWRRSPGAARFRLDVDGWTAVCFAAPVCELLSAVQIAAHPSLAALGPDLVADELDLGAAGRRLAAAADQAIGEALLDQRIAAGIGNVYKSEVLFVCGVDPWAAVSDLDEATRERLLATAARLLRRNTVAGRAARTTTDNRVDRLHVYGKRGRPCPRCGTPIRARRQGDQARTTYWCPGCQPAHEPAQRTVTSEQSRR